MATVLFAEQAAPRKLVARQISASAWFVQGDAALGSPVNRNFISNAGFVVTPAGVVVIDALGSPQLARDLLDEIEKITPQPVTHVVVTHYHADHVYGLQEFRKRGARIIAQRSALEYIHSDTATARLRASRIDLAPWIDGKTELVLPDQWIDGPTELVVGGQRLRLQPVGPAHTPEDLVVFVPSERVLFAGDIVFRGRIPFVGQADSRHWIDALDTLIKMDAKVVVPGHGELSTAARDDLQLTRDYLSFLRESMRSAARDMEPFDEAYARVDWSRFENLPLFRAANRMNAYNTYLLMEQQSR
ncbi:MAG: MBL fold metallo-hydrolase [Burkholderiaceae bacterium]|nr:MBL fold metallo-hydrolase [Burkholderiaceae bacterium]